MGDEQVGGYDTIVIGGGPAGLFCAIQCSVPGRRILLIEKKKTCGNKLLITGSGQCNITHAGEIRNFPAHYGSQGAFLKPALLGFTNRDLAAFFTGHGIPVMTDKGGKIFPASRSSRDILDLLIRECNRLGVMIRCSEPVLAVKKEPESFRITTAKDTYSAGSLVIATGGKTYPATGSSGDGYHFAASLGHAIITPAPALTPVYIRNFPFSGLSGLSFPGMAFSVWREGKKVSDYTGDVLITHKGLSGPGILDHSRSIVAGDEIRLSFTGNRNRDVFERDLAERMQNRGRHRISAILASYQLPSRLVQNLMERSGITQDVSCAHLTAGQRKQLVTAMTGFSLLIDSMGDYSVAMVTRGGVALSEVNPRTMESRLSGDLYFAGEVLDIDGDSGGYNLQAAFSTGRLAGQSIRKRWDPA